MNVFSGPYVFLKGQCHEMYIFVEGLNILISTFCVCADGFQGLSKALHYSIQLLTFNFLLWKYFSEFENAYWNPPQNSLLCDWSVFSSADLSMAAEKMRRIILSQAVSGMILQNHRLLPICIFIVQIALNLGSLKRVTPPVPTPFNSKLLDDMNGFSSTSDIFFHDLNLNYVCAFVELSFRFGGCETFMFLRPMRVCPE